MSIFKCKMCGGDLEIAEGVTIAECDYCGTKQTVPKAIDENMQNLFNRANTLRIKSEFDKAEKLYEKIIQSDSTQSEAYWGLILCKYGIEYVDDPVTFKKIPTCHRASYDSIIADDDYKSAIDNADMSQRMIYEEQAKEIDRIQKEILALAQKEESYDVFICYKETDASGSRTQDSVIANDIYYQLTNEGYKVFYAAITLEGKLGSAYEPIIFAALNSAKVMLAIGTKPEYFNAVWVKNEWSRYLKIIKNDRSKLLIPCYRDMDAYELPDEFAHLQAQDMAKIGFINDLVRGIQKVITKDEPKKATEESTSYTAAPANIAPLLKRAFMFLEDGEWSKADDFCEQVLNQDPENAQAYLGKLMAELRVKKQADLKDCEKPFDDRNNYKKVMRFADNSLKSTLVDYIECINARIEIARKESIIESAKECMRHNGINRYEEAIQILESIKGFREADQLIAECYKKIDILKAEIEENRKARTYNNAVNYMSRNTISGYKEAIGSFESIIGYRDSDELLNTCRNKREALEIQAEADRVEEERKAEIARIEEAKRKKKNKIIASIAIPILLLVVFACIIYDAFIIPSNNYNDAMSLLEDGKYSEAEAAFQSLGEYKDSATMILECKYLNALELFDKKEYSQALEIFQWLGAYKDGVNKIEECKIAILDEKYNKALVLMDAGKYDEAISAFEELENYKDSADKLSACKYNDAVASIGSGNFVDAYEVLIKLNGYKDSVEKANSIYDKYKVEKLKVAEIGDYIFFGSYEQDNNASNGKENIKWRVLDVKDGQVLVISSYALDCKEYNDRDAKVTWKTCSLRTWLNNDFVNTSFSADEKAMIPTVLVTADYNPDYQTNPGNATYDQVFLLSIVEVDKYFSSYGDRKCIATDYAVANGAERKSSSGNCTNWWLRTPGETQDQAACVYYGGGVIAQGFPVSLSYYNDTCVRPAMWITIPE